MNHLLPEYSKTIDPNHMKTTFEKLQQLRENVEQMMNYHDHPEEHLKKTKLIVDIDHQMKQGKQEIGDLWQWVSTNLNPKSNSDNPLVQQLSKLISMTLNWYLDLRDIWDKLLEEYCCTPSETKT